MRLVTHSPLPTNRARGHWLRVRGPVWLFASALYANAAVLCAQGTPMPESTAVARLRQSVVASSAFLAASRAELAAAGARMRAAGGPPPAVLSAEIEEVPSGVDVTDAGSLRLELSREFLSGFAACI